MIRSSENNQTVVWMELTNTVTREARGECESTDETSGMGLMELRACETRIVVAWQRALGTTLGQPLPGGAGGHLGAVFCTPGQQFFLKAESGRCVRTDFKSRLSHISECGK